jgi:hypothetical protein
LPERVAPTLVLLCVPGLWQPDAQPAELLERGQRAATPLVALRKAFSEAYRLHRRMAVLEMLCPQLLLTIVGDLADVCLEAELRGLRVTLAVLVLMGAWILWGTLPADGFLRDPDTGSLLRPPFMSGIVALTFLGGALAGLAYRIGDSTTNVISPMMSCFALIIAFFQRYEPRAGIGTLVATMLPYSVIFPLAWIVMLLAWVAVGLPLGPRSRRSWRTLPAGPPRAGFPVALLRLVPSPAGRGVPSTLRPGGRAAAVSLLAFLVLLVPAAFQQSVPRPLTPADALVEIPFSAQGHLVPLGDVDRDGEQELAFAVCEGRAWSLVLVRVTDGALLRTLWSGPGPGGLERDWDAGADLDLDGVPDVVIARRGARHGLRVLGRFRRRPRRGRTRRLRRGGSGDRSGRAPRAG